MKVAIVGSSKMKFEDCMGTIVKIIDNEDPDLIISGGADGVDTSAIIIATKNFIKTKVFQPKTKDWKGYKPRNLLIANECDKLFNIVIKNEKSFCYHHKIKGHVRSGGCYTELKAKEKGKITETIII